MTKAYGDMSAAAVQQASDLALVTVRLGQTSFLELAAAIGKTTPLAAALGVRQAELAASYATLTGVVGSTSEVSTGLRGILSGLIRPTKGLREAVAALDAADAQALEGAALPDVAQKVARVGARVPDGFADPAQLAGRERRRAEPRRERRVLQPGPRPLEGILHAAQADRNADAERRAGRHGRSSPRGAASKSNTRAVARRRYAKMASMSVKTHASSGVRASGRQWRSKSTTSVASVPSASA